MKTNNFILIFFLLFSLNLNSTIYYGSISLYRVIDWDEADNYDFKYPFNNPLIIKQKISEEEYCLKISTTIRIIDNRPKKPTETYVIEGTNILCQTVQFFVNHAMTNILDLSTFQDAHGKFYGPGHIISITDQYKNILKLTLDNTFEHLPKKYEEFKKNQKRCKCEDYCVIQ